MSPVRDDQKDHFRDVLRSIHLIMVESFALRQVKVTPLGSEGSRLSIPVKVEGVNSNGAPVRYFAKILGGSDIMTEKTIQFFKNVYLQMEGRQPLFNFTRSAKDLANHQYDTMSRIHGLGIPTAKPLGTFALPGGLWLFVSEFLEVAAMAPKGKVSEAQLDEAFGHLRLMHKSGIFHGDIKPENFLFADRVYIMDVGHFIDDAPDKEKLSYDLACQIASFIEYTTPEKIVKLAKNHYSARDLKRAGSYLELIDRRPDFRLTTEKKEKLVSLLG
jgi:serine/threonine-protein kinase RIO1